MTESHKIASPIKDIAINFYIPVDKLLYQEDVNDKCLSGDRRSTGFEYGLHAIVYDFRGEEQKGRRN
jgi:hypothetical protein